MKISSRLLLVLICLIIGVCMMMLFTGCFSLEYNLELKTPAVVIAVSDKAIILKEANGNMKVYAGTTYEGGALIKSLNIGDTIK